MRELVREARAASGLNHPNIVTVFDIGESEDTEYLAMEFVEGETLRARMNRAPMSIQEAREIGLQIAYGLAEAHRHGIIHRDLKPENIMLRVDGMVKLVDFGLDGRVGSDRRHVRLHGFRPTYRPVHPQSDGRWYFS